VVDEVFFHKYFSQIGKAKQAAGKKKASSKAAGGSDHVNEDDNDENDEDEDEIWQALVDSRPEVEGNSDDESDLEMLDLDDPDSVSSSLSGAAVDSGDVEDAEFDEGDALDIFEEDDALLGSGEDAPSGIDGLFETKLQTRQKRDPSKDEESNKKKRRKLKNLPTFAAVEDYVEMLEEDEVL
jgi:ribosome biogenesis protein MAK21